MSLTSDQSNDEYNFDWIEVLFKSNVKRELFWGWDFTSGPG